MMPRVGGPFLVAALLCVAPILASAQDTARVKTGALFFSLVDARAARAAETDRTAFVFVVSNAALLLPSGDTIATDVLGKVLVPNLPAGRVEVVFKARDYSPMRCRLTVRADAVDTVHVEMLSERTAAVFTKSGCRQGR